VKVSFAVLVVSASALAGAPKRPAVDLSAMREAMGVATDETGTPYPSAASYAHFLRARLAHHDGDHKVALDELRLALASDDSNPFLMTELAEQYARASELERAELQLKRVIERFPDYQPAQLLMGRVLYEGQKSTRARTHLLRAIKLKPNDPDAYLVLTQLWLDQGRTDDAIKVVDELGTALPGDPVGSPSPSAVMARAPRSSCSGPSSATPVTSSRGPRWGASRKRRVSTSVPSTRGNGRSSTTPRTARCCSMQAEWPCA
jgi:tetratricopeptide (TPR) repeat protein